MSPTTRQTNQKRAAVTAKKTAGKKKAPPPPNAEDLQAAVAKLQAQNAKLLEEKAKMIDLTTQSAASSRRSSGKKPQSRMIRYLHGEIVSKTWRTIKFVTDEEQEEKFARKLARGLVTINQDQLPAWIEAHVATICSQLNGHRSYVINQLKGDAYRWWCNHGKTLPSVEDIVRCLERNIDMKNDYGKELMVWWVDTFLAHAAGNQHDWNKAKRWYGTISTMAPQNRARKLYMPASTEAFAALAYENCRAAWLEQFALKDEFPDYKLVVSKMVVKEGDKTWAAAPEGTDGNPVVPPSDANGVPDYQFLQGMQIGCLHPKYKGQYSKSDCGSERAGGWTDDGLHRFNELVALNKAARATEDGQALEQEVLDRLRQMHGITAISHALHLTSKKRKRKDPKEPTAKINTWDDDDSDMEPEERDKGGKNLPVKTRMKRRTRTMVATTSRQFVGVFARNICCFSPLFLPPIARNSGIPPIVGLLLSPKYVPPTGPCGAYFAPYLRGYLHFCCPFSQGFCCIMPIFGADDLIICVIILTLFSI